MMHHDNDQIPMKTHAMTMVPDMYLLPSLSTIQAVIHHGGEQIRGAHPRHLNRLFVLVCLPD